MLKRRRRFKQTSFQDRLASFAKDMREQASRLPPGAGRNNLLKRAGNAEIAADLDKWVQSPELHGCRYKAEGASSCKIRSRSSSL